MHRSWNVVGKIALSVLAKLIVQISEQPSAKTDFMSVASTRSIFGENAVQKGIV